MCYSHLPLPSSTLSDALILCKLIGVALGSSRSFCHRRCRVVTSRSMRETRHRRVVGFILRHSRRYYSGIDAERVSSEATTCCERGSLVQHGARPERSRGRRITCNDWVSFVPTRPLRACQSHRVNQRSYRSRLLRPRLTPQSPILPLHSHVQLTDVTTDQRTRSPNVHTSAAS